MPSQIHAQLDAIDAIDAIDGNLHAIEEKPNPPIPDGVMVYHKCPRCDYTDPDGNDVAGHMERIHKL